MCRPDCNLDHAPCTRQRWLEKPAETVTHDGFGAHIVRNSEELG
jgi:hypothetical protein